jgi:hypothetical protein
MPWPPNCRQPIGGPQAQHTVEILQLNRAAIKIPPLITLSLDKHDTRIKLLVQLLSFRLQSAAASSTLQISLNYPGEE